MRKIWLGCFLLLLLNGGFARSQSNDVQDTLPPSKHGLDDGNFFRPINPWPFKGCRIIINRNPVSGQLTLETILKNMGYKSNVKVLDSVVVITIDAVAEAVMAHNNVSASLPYRFDLYAIINGQDTAKYRVEYLTDRNFLTVSIDPRLRSKKISIEPVKRVQDSMCWVLFDSNKIPGNFRENVEPVAIFQVLEAGRYWELPFPIERKNKGKVPYNEASNRRVVFFKLLDGYSSAPVLESLLRQYQLAGEKIVFGYLHPSIAP